MMNRGSLLSFALVGRYILQRCMSHDAIYEGGYVRCAGTCDNEYMMVRRGVVWLDFRLPSTPVWDVCSQLFSKPGFARASRSV